MLNFIQLQAAMGLGIVLAFFGLCLVFVVLPILIVIYTKTQLSQMKQQSAKLDARQYTLAFMTGLLYAILTVFAFAAGICLLVYFFVDLSYC